jgi:glycosyltransferase involved in cell wall biosynthesis
LNILLVTSQFFPKRTSAAIQMRDLAQEFVRQGHFVLLVTPAEKLNLSVPSALDIEGIKAIYLSSIRISNVGYVRRVLGEFLMPYLMYGDFKRSEYFKVSWDMIVWYSPSIFLTPLISRVRSAFNKKCTSYLILRDIFPEWTLHTDILRKGIIYRFFQRIAAHQYNQADVIGIQSPSNAKFLDHYALGDGTKIEVLENWLNTESNEKCVIQISNTPLAGRNILVYIGNMGVAQNIDALLHVAESLNARTDIGFLFIGRGSEVARLKELIETKGLINTLFYDEVPSNQLPDLLAQCKLGLVSLSLKHETHNIPGKFLTYMREGLPVLAHINPDSDLERLIIGSKVGAAYSGSSISNLRIIIEDLLTDVNTYQVMSKNALNLYREKFSPVRAAKQIVYAANDVINS